MVTPAAKRKAVSHLMANHGMSERRACKAIGGCRMTVRYNSRRPDDAVVRERMLMIARERRRFGYRRLLALLRREGHVVNHKKLFRLYRADSCDAAQAYRFDAARDSWMMPPTVTR